MSRKPRYRPPTAKDRAIDAIYAEIPAIPGCTGACATACGPIVMFDAEWDRVKRASPGGIKPFNRTTFNCPMLSPTGRCMVYSARPYICRLWGTTPTLACPEGCEPTKWLNEEEARDIFTRLQEIAGPGTDGPVGDTDDLWAAFALDARSERAARVELIRQGRMRGEIE